MPQPFTDQEILSQIQAVLMEPADGGATFPSGLWTKAEVLANLNERQDRFLKATNTWVGVANLTGVIGVRIYALPQDWLGTIAATWQGADGRITPLQRSDSFEADRGMPSWGTDLGTPLLYMSEDTELLTIQIAPAPDAAGTLQVIYVPQGAPLDGTGEPFTLTDEYAQQVGKYGTLADCFGKDGRGKNPDKAAYAESRYQLAVEMAGIVLNGWT